MKILFSPSEAKSTNSPINSPLCENLSFKNLYNIRLHVIKQYNLFLKTASLQELSKMVGIKDEEELENYKNLDILNSSLEKAILRYTGVGYKYLDFLTLSKNEKEVILNSMVIFSNLFGPILAKDALPYYKLKQGENIGDFIPHKHYKEHTSKTLDEFLDGEFIIDLRAGFYDKFYKPKHETITFKFFKDGKIVSHYAKAYRGLMARDLAKYNPKDEKELQDIPFPNLLIKEIRVQKNVKTYVYEIVQ